MGRNTPEKKKKNADTEKWGSEPMLAIKIFLLETTHRFIDR